MNIKNTVLIVDDDVSTLTALTRVLRHHGYQVKTFGDPACFIESIQPAYGHAHCVILDMHLPGLRGLDIQNAIIDRGIPLPVIFLSGKSEVPEVISGLKRGAVDFLLKPVDLDELLVAVERAFIPASAEADGKPAFLKKLSKREAEVMVLVAKGMRSQPIADALGIGLRTVKMHRGNIMAKAGVSSMGELLAVFHT